MHPKIKVSEFGRSIQYERKAGFKFYPMPPWELHFGRLVPRGFYDVRNFARPRVPKTPVSCIRPLELGLGATLATMVFLYLLLLFLRNWA